MGAGRGKNLLFCFLLIFTASFLHSGDAAGQTIQKSTEKTQAEVSFLQGKADALSKGETAWRSLRVGSLLSPEEEIRTGDRSRIEIRLPDRSIMRFDQRSTFRLRSIFFNVQEGSREVKVEVPVGKAWANVRKAFGPKRTFEVASANAVAGVRDTIWRMNADPDRSTLIRVYEGTVEVYSPFARPEYKPEEGGFKAPREVRGPQEVPRPYEEVTKEQWEQIVLTQMMQLLVPAVGRPERPTAFRAEEDRTEEWVRWNQQRDREIRP